MVVTFNDFGERDIEMVVFPIIILMGAITLVRMARRRQMVKELIEKRQENSKTFELDNGQRQLVISMGAVHYMDNYNSDEPWKDIDLTWEGNKITKAPYELTLEGNKITIRDKKSGEVSTIELLDISSKKIPCVAWERSKGLARIKDIALDTDLEITAEFGRVKFTRILKSDKAPTDAQFKVTGNFKVRASDEDGELRVESSLVNGKLTEELIPENQDRPIKYPVRIDPTYQVGTGTDDCAREIAQGFFSLTHGYNRVGSGYWASRRQWGCGMRFTNIAIPQGATIADGTYLIFRASAAQSTSTVNSKISAEDVDDAVTFADDEGIFDNRFNNHTTARIDWNSIASWIKDTDYDSPEIKTVIKEIVDRGGWNSGQDIVIFWEDFDDNSSTDAYRSGKSYDVTTSLCPQLVITLPSAPTVTTDPADDIEDTIATLNGTVTDDGGDTIDYYGFVWDDDSDEGNPGDSDPSTPAGTWENGWKSSGGDWGENPFDHAITGLPESTTIYFRATAHNSEGWSYGAAQSFRTSKDLESSDSGSAVESTISLLVELVKSESGSGVEAISNRLASFEDSGIGADISSLLAEMLKADSGSATESLTLSAIMAVVDSGIASEALVSKLLLLADSGTGLEASAKLPVHRLKPVGRRDGDRVGLIGAGSLRVIAFKTVKNRRAK